MAGVLRTVLEAGTTFVVVGVAVVMLVLFLIDRRENHSPEGLPETGVTLVEDWKTWRESAIRMGPNDASVVVAVFMDFECPYCQALVPVLDSLSAEFPRDVAVDFHHFPLAGHRFTLMSARAAECAQRQDRFGAMYRLLFNQMDSLGSKAWLGFAEEAEVPDLSAFAECIERPAEDFPRIRAGRELGERIGVTGTPTIWINGELYREERTLKSFRKKVRRRHT